MNINGNVFKNNDEQINEIIKQNESKEDTTTKNIKLDIKKVDQTIYLPKLLLTRLQRREKVKTFSIVFFLYNIVLLVLGVIYIDASSFTRKYIRNGDEFWNFVFENKKKPKELSLLCSFAGIFEILCCSFNIMNGLVILKHIFKGGLRIRLSFSIYSTTIIQVFNFGFSFFIIVNYGLVVNLNILLFLLNFFHLVIAIVFFYHTRKIIRKEEDYMLPLKTLILHKMDYFNEYKRKLNN